MKPYPSFRGRPLKAGGASFRALMLAGAAIGLANIAVPNSAWAQAVNAPAMSAAFARVTHHTIKIGNVDVHYREAGPSDAPVLLLLHGFPTSSHMFRDLIPQLSDKYHVIAPDYPGFGDSGQPILREFDYSFDALAGVVDDLTQKLGVKNYYLYMQDYGGPVGFRLAVAHPERIRGLIIQNATVHVEGWNPDIVKQFMPFWKERNAETEKPIRAFLKPETTKFQYTQGSTRVDRLSPDAWTLDIAHLARPGNEAVQMQYLFNYQANLGQYPAWQAYLKTKQPPTLIVWGKNDPFFNLAGVDALKAILPKATVNIYDAGHFALETHGEEIGTAIREFLANTAH